MSKSGVYSPSSSSRHHSPSESSRRTSCKRARRSSSSSPLQSRSSELSYGDNIYKPPAKLRLVPV
jgi:hypothetical protein